MFDIRRENYTEYQLCSYLVSDKEVNPNDITIRTMNYGQCWRSHVIVESPYKVMLPVRYVVDFLETEYTELRTFCIEEKDDPDPLCLEFEMAAANYPETIQLIFNDIIRYANLINELILWFEWEILDSWLGNHVDSHLIPTYAINSVTSVSLRENLIIVEGICRNALGETFKMQDI